MTQARRLHWLVSVPLATAFAIGGADGLASEVLDAAAARLSAPGLTFR